MRAQIQDIYNYCVHNNRPLFGPVSGFSFMADYAENHAAFDFFFNKRFSSFRYLTEFAKNSTAENVYNNFTQGINAFLFFNKKRFEELYRVQVLSNNAYDIVNNYDLTETSSRTGSGSDSRNYGARSDSDTFGARTDTSEVTNGKQKSTTEKSIAGFNSSNYSDSDKETTTVDEYTNGGTTTKGAQNDTHTVGAHTDTGTTSTSETVNLRRFGNIGVQTAAEIIGGHVKLWENFNFYEILFTEIAREFLLVDDDFTTDNGGSAFSESDVAEILASLNQLKAQLAESTSDIMDEISDVRGDITDVNGNVNDAEGSILSAMQAQTNTISLSVANLKASTLAAETRIIANDNANAALIRGDITGVVTNGY